MKTLQRIAFHGSEQSRRTGWLRRSGFALAYLCDGSTRFFPEDMNTAAILAALEASGISVSDYRGKLEAARQADIARNTPGEREQAAELYQHNYGHEKPVSLGKWSWSYTFGRWSRLVTFADGWNGYSYPKL